MKAAAAFLVTLTLGLGLSLGLSRTWQPNQVFTSQFDNVMGTSLDVKVLAVSDLAAHEAEEAALAEITRLSAILSTYDSGSEVSRWLRAGPTPMRVSPELAEVLTAFDDWHMRTGGALDPAAEAVSRVWRGAADAQRLPAASELRAAVTLTQQSHWVLERATSTLTRTSAAPLALNSFTKSYVTDRAARRALAVAGVRGVLLNAGGDIVVRGDWSERVGVADPVANADNAPALATLRLRDRVVATSGGGKRGFDIDGIHYSHIVDPRTGQPAGHVLSATVVSRDAVEAGALATSFCVLSPAESVALARTRPGVEYAIVLANGSHVESDGWRTLAETTPARERLPKLVQPVFAAEQATGAAPVSVAIDLGRPAMMARRPYVAVWVEDKDKFPVRTVALWYDGKARWLPELRAWYRSDRLRSMAEGSSIVDAVTSATRQAGKYTLQWDGKDNAGKPVKPGVYTVYIEASREHGGYDLVKQEVDLAGGAKSFSLTGSGGEISGASIDVRGR